ncbi:questin oxidase family protein [Streptomyces sp. NPDC008001]|uniref:questin oxidase family protein n=1 Tax=Streptomyces sp. NPDC008001 TaxID=3364804 RepID=UPI0036E6BF30
MDTGDTRETRNIADTSGVLGEALQRLHASGPERLGRLTNHAPMVAEALVAHGHAGAVHHWLDLYEERLEEFPAAVAPVTDDDWATALGDPRRVADWIAYFGRALPEHGWRGLLATWWPRLLPGMYGGSTHPVIRVGHAVRALLRDGESEPRLTELTHGLGYWAARHHPLAGLTRLPGAPDAAGSLRAVPPIRVREGGFPARLALVDRLPAWAGDVTDPAAARRRLAELVAAATHRYATHGHGDATMLVHAATAPSAVLRTLPALPQALWVPSLHAAWVASAAVTAMYAPAEAVPCASPGAVTAGDVVERAVAHGDEHVIKLADTAMDVTGEQAHVAAPHAAARAHAAVLRAIELSEPLS